MNRLTNDDRNFGPFTLGRWSNTLMAIFSTGDEEEEDRNRNHLLFVAFGWALRIQLPNIVPPQRIRHEALIWDEDTINRLGRNWYYVTHKREFGISLSKMGEGGYDFLQIKYGPQTHDSSTDHTWSKSLPWTQWRCVRNSSYAPDGEHFATEEKGKFFEFMRYKEQCPASYFGFEDHDGEMVIATCAIEEREWHRGEGWFSWLRWFWPARICRSLDIKFSAEVGPEKGSWKGGTIGHGIEMESGETPEQAFRRYCAKEHDARHGRKFRIRYIGPCAKPPAKQSVSQEECRAQTNIAK